MPPFFPNPGFAWAFALLLMAGMAAAAWVDLRTLTVPKRITLSLLAAGVLANLIRGAWLGADGYGVWAFGPSGVAGGAADGLLFAVCGFLVGFGVFFVLWILGVGGGGDVKLAAAVGAWLGPAYLLGAVVLAVPVVIVLTLVRLGLALARGRSAGEAPAVKWRLLSYSLPLAVGVAILLAIGLFGLRVKVTPG